TAAGSGRITALEGEDALGGQAVAVGVVEILLPGQGQEAVDGAGCALGVEGHGQIAGTRGDGGLDLTGRLRGLGRNVEVLGRQLLSTQGAPSASRGTARSPARVAMAASTSPLACGVWGGTSTSLAAGCEPVG